MRYRVYHVLSPDKTDMRKRKGYILIVVDMQNSLINLWGTNADFYTIPRKRITFKMIGMLTNPVYSSTLEKEYLDYIIDSSLITKEYELLPHNSSK